MSNEVSRQALTKRSLNHHGGERRKEELDTTPMEIPLGASTPPSLNELMLNFIRNEVAAQKQEEYGSFEEEDDFEEDDPNTLDFSKYELTDGVEEEPLLPETPSEPPEAAEKEKEGETPPSESAERPDEAG